MHKKKYYMLMLFAKSLNVGLYVVTKLLVWGIFHEMHKRRPALAVDMYGNYFRIKLWK